MEPGALLLSICNSIRLFLFPFLLVQRPDQKGTDVIRKQISALKPEKDDLRRFSLRCSGAPPAALQSEPAHFALAPQRLVERKRPRF